VGELDKNRLVWKSRRGMLELDLLFSKFVNEKLNDISQQQKETFNQLLNCEDDYLFRLIMNVEAAPSASERELIAMLQQLNRS
jgi:antitoxin CptB